jgi:hypothetical protein
MTEQQIIDELDSVIAYCDVVKNKATGLRRKLARLYDPTSPKRGKKTVVSDEVIAKVLAGRQKFMNRKAEVFHEEEHRATAKKLANAERRAANNLKRVKYLRKIVDD